MEKDGNNNNQSYPRIDQTTGETYHANLIENKNSEDTGAISGNNVVIHVVDNVAHFKDTEKQGLAFKSGRDGYVLSLRTNISDNLCFKFSNGRDVIVTTYTTVFNYGVHNMIIYHIPTMGIENLQTGPTVVHVDTGETYKYRAGVVRCTDDEHTIIGTNIKHVTDASKWKIIFDKNTMVPCCDVTRSQDTECINLLLMTAEVPDSINLTSCDKWLKDYIITQEKDGNNDNQNYPRIDQTTGETYHVNLIENKQSEDTGAISGKNVVIHVVDNVEHFTDTETQGLAFKSGREGYVLSIRRGRSDNLWFKFSNDDGREMIVTNYTTVFNYRLHNMIIYHLPNMIIDNLHAGPTVVHVDTGKTYKYRAGVVRSINDEHTIIGTNIKPVTDASKWEIMFNENTIRCQDTECVNLLLKTADLPDSINLTAYDQWLKDYNITQKMDKRQKTGRELGTQAKFKLKGGLKPTRNFDVFCDQSIKINIISPVSCVDEISDISANCRQYLHNMMLAALEDLHNNGGILALPPTFEVGNMKMNNQLTRVRSEDLINMQTGRYSNEFFEIEKLGKGGFGSVYKVKNRLDGKCYAIKKIKFKHKRHEQLLKILKEVKTLAGLHNTNIVGYNAAWLEYTNSPSSIQTSRSSSSQAEFSASEEKSHINEANSRSFDIDFRLESGSEDELDPVTGTQLHKHYNTSKCTITEITHASDKTTILESNVQHNIDEDSHGISQSNTDNFLDEDTNISTTDNLDKEPDNKLFVQTLRNKHIDKSQEISSSSDKIFLDDGLSDENHNSPKNSNISKKSLGGRLAPYRINALNTKSRSELRNENSDIDSSDSVEISSSNSDSPQNKDNHLHLHIHVTSHFSSKLYDNKSSFITIPQKSKYDIDSPKDRVVPYRRSVSAEPLKDTAGIQNHFVDNFPHQPIVQLYIQMELCQQTLQMRLFNRNSKLKDMKDLVDYKEENLKIIHQILTGVDYIHSKGLIHRDLKPPNIFLLEPGLHVKIGDFGLATEDVLGGVCKDTIIAPSPDVKDHFKLENLTSGVGTSTYAAPEQLTGNFYDSKSDIYSIGVILFEVFNVFNTEMERHRSITGLRDGCYSPIFDSYWPDVSDAIMKMTNTIAQDRPTANSLLDSQLFLTKDQMIASLQKQLREKCDYILNLKNK